VEVIKNVNRVTSGNVSAFWFKDSPVISTIDKLVVDPWEDIPDTYDKPKLCRLEDDQCEACQ